MLLYSTNHCAQGLRIPFPSAASAHTMCAHRKPASCLSREQISDVVTGRNEFVLVAACLPSMEARMSIPPSSGSPFRSLLSASSTVGGGEEVVFMVGPVSRRANSRTPPALGCVGPTQIRSSLQSVPRLEDHSRFRDEAGSGGGQSRDSYHN